MAAKKHSKVVETFKGNEERHDEWQGNGRNE